MKTKCAVNLSGFIILGVLIISCSQTQEQNANKKNSRNSLISKHTIVVDGETADWEGIPAVTVEDKEHLWFGEGLPEGAWKGKNDLSFSWRTTWNNDRLFFLFEVQDDTLSNFDQDYAWLNDCIEIYIDPHGSGGSRIKGIGSENSLEDRIGRKMHGYEMQFLPTQPPKVYVDDSKGIYFTDADQNAAFQEQWQGEAVIQNTTDGYLMEIAFAVPEVSLQSGKKLGMDVAVCDDDGAGRKSLMIWSGYKGEFWLTMDNFKTMGLE